MDYGALLNQYMYHDRVTISRETAYKDDIGADDFGLTDVATDVPCQLSQNSQRGITIETGNISTSSAELKLYAAPDVDIQTGDTLTVISRQGQRFVLTASRKFSYTTHCEVVCTYNREVSALDGN